MASWERVESHQTEAGATGRLPGVLGHQTVSTVKDTCQSPNSARLDHLPSFAATTTEAVVAYRTSRWPRDAPHSPIKNLGSNRPIPPARNLRFDNRRCRIAAACRCGPDAAAAELRVDLRDGRTPRSKRGGTRRTSLPPGLRFRDRPITFGRNSASPLASTMSEAWSAGCFEIDIVFTLM